MIQDDTQYFVKPENDAAERYDIVRAYLRATATLLLQQGSGCAVVRLD